MIIQFVNLVLQIAQLATKTIVTFVSNHFSYKELFVFHLAIKDSLAH